AVRKLHPQLPMTRVLAAEQILAFFFDHIFEKHAAQFRHGTFLIADAEEAVNIAKLVELVFCPALKLLSGQAAAQQQLANRMRPWMALLQSSLQVIDKFCRTE